MEPMVCPASAAPDHDAGTSSGGGGGKKRVTLWDRCFLSLLDPMGWRNR